MGHERIQLLLGVALALATAGVLLSAVTGGPYLTADSVNPFAILYVAGLFGALFAVPFWIEASLRATEPDRDKRWERALVVWAMAAALVIGVGACLWAAFGFDGSSFGGMLAIGMLTDGILVGGTLVFWMLSG